MGKDDVSVALGLVIEEIERVAGQLMAENTQAFQAKRFDEAKRLVDSASRVTIP